MPASEAQIRANQANSARSTGPRTPEGKEQSRANSYKHGLTATVVLPEREAVEVERRVLSFCEELQPSGDVGLALVRHAATMSVRMERCVAQETASLTARVRQAEDDFEAPEGVDEATAARLRAEAGKLAMFDPSKEACLARSYEASATRGFFRALKELRQIEKAVKAAEAEIAEEVYQKTLASFSRKPQPIAEVPPTYPATAPLGSRNRFEPASTGDLSTFEGRVDVPITIGQHR